jgi:hypothetical protein
MGENRNAFKTLVEKPDGKSGFGRPKRRWEDNITMGLKELLLESMAWIDMAQNSFLLNMVMKIGFYKKLEISGVAELYYVLKTEAAPFT